MYFQLGTLAAMSLVHRGAAFRIFCPTVFSFLSGKSAADLIASITEVPDPAIRELLKQVWLKLMFTCMGMQSIINYN